MTAPPGGAGAATLRPWQAVAIVVGIVVGAGIFKTPALVAGQVPSVGWMLALWAAGGLLTLCGALVYAELSTTWPSHAGEYHFLGRAWGRPVASLYAWARFTVITTGSLVLLGYVYGDYATQLLPLGPHSAAWHAGLAIAVLTALNLRSLRSGANAQALMTALELLGLLLIVAAGLAVAAGFGPVAATAAGPTAGPAAVPGLPAAGPTAGALGLAMVFVLLTYGGWNDAAYLSADLRGRRAIAGVLLVSVAIVTALYLAVNAAYAAILGRAGLAASAAPAADALRVVFGAAAGQLVAAMVAMAALTSMNATLIVGARTAQALGEDWPVLRGLGRWDAGRGTPPVALLAQGALALALVVLAAAGGRGFQAMVEFTAPVFWLFFLLTGLALFRLRAREPLRPRPFRVPGYPVLPALFCLSCAGMLWSSLGYVGGQRLAGVSAAWVGLAVLGSGALALALLHGLERRARRI